MVKVRPLEEKRLLATAGRHQFVTDRKQEEGRQRCRFARLASCCSLRSAPARPAPSATSCADPDRLEVSVDYEPATEPGERETIAIVIGLPAEILATESEAILEVARDGGVVSRMLLGSHLALCCEPR